jgi:uncharacterized protein (DUF2147 family)
MMAVYQIAIGRAVAVASLLSFAFGSATTVIAQGLPAAAVPAPPTPSAATDVLGIWIDHTGRGAVEIVQCGQKACGYIYWVKDTVKNGAPVVDAKNPDPKRRNKPICGTQVLIDVVQQKAARLGHIWGGGSIYDPEEGEKFDVELKLVTANELSVMGYAGLKFLSETYSWKRAPADLVRCGPPRV